MTENSEGFVFLALPFQALKKRRLRDSTIRTRYVAVVSQSVVEILRFRILVASDHGKYDRHQTSGSKYLLKSRKRDQAAYRQLYKNG